MLALIVVGCSSTGHIDGPALISPRPPVFGGGGMDGIVAGSLVFDEPGGCLFLELDGIRNPVVWPAGASWNSDLGAVALKNRIVEPGMFISGAGGYVSAAQIESAAWSDIAAAAAACADPGVDIAVFNSGSEVTISGE